MFAVVTGRGRAKGFTLNSEEILEALQESLTTIVQSVKGALEQSPPELASDIAERVSFSPVVVRFYADWIV